MKTNKKKSSARRKLLPAVAMLAVSAISLSSATYAWFTMNKEVKVEGMMVRTKVGDNLLICTTNMDSDFTSTPLSQSRKALLEPVSSVTGATGSFYYTVDAKADGDAVSDVYYPYFETGSGTTANSDAKAGKNAYMNGFQTSYGNTVSTSEDFGIAYGYVDYTFYLKATSSAAGQKVVMSQCDLDYVGNALATSGASGALGKEGGPDRAWRVAVFATSTSVPQGTGVLATDIAIEGNQKGLIALADAENQTANMAVSAENAAPTAITNNASGSGVVLDTISTANVTKYYKVVVRLWLEGEDNTCTSETYAKLTNSYSLDMAFKIVESSDTDTAVKEITNNQFTIPSGTRLVGNQWDSGS
ncbi:MAG: hypothetical protein IKO47_02865 [Ruminococcus sp.]|nr:hypothetical protein [Ruminococcus sp.]